MLGKREQLHMRIAVILSIGGKLVRYIAIGEHFSLFRTHPGAKMQLVNAHGFIVRCLAVLYAIYSVVPFVIVIPCAAGRFGTELSKSRKGVGLVVHAAVAVFQCKLICPAHAYIRDIFFPYAAVAHRLHCIRSRLPVVPVAYHAYAHGIGRPYGKIIAVNLPCTVKNGTRSEHIICFKVRPLTEQINIKRAYEPAFVCAGLPTLQSFIQIKRPLISLYRQGSDAL